MEAISLKSGLKGIIETSEKIGEGEHERYIVESTKFREKVYGKFNF